MIKLQCYLTGYNRKADRSCNIRFETQELTSEQLLELDKHYQAFGHLLFKENEINLSEMPTEDALEGQKTASKRLRAVMFILWSQRGKNGDFEAFYRVQIEKIIDQIKTKLD